MARPIRIDVKGGWYHVTARGIERRAIFEDDGEYVEVRFVGLSLVETWPCSATGVCRLFLQVDAGAEGAQPVPISPRFWAGEDVGNERTAWVRAVERRKSYLEDAIRLAPESAEATAAKRLLRN